MNSKELPYNGLSAQEVLLSRKQHGSNNMAKGTNYVLLHFLLELLKEPMIILLLATSGLYFFQGHLTDAYFMLGSIFLVIGLSVFQNWRTEKALESLTQFIVPKAEVVRDGKVKQILIEELVIADIIIISEGSTIPTDAKVLKSHDFLVNESIMTGESRPVAKADNEVVMKGTTISTGMAYCEVTAIGEKTELGKLGQRLKDIKEGKSPLEIQINRFVIGMVSVGAVVLCLVWLYNYLITKNILDSLMKALTLAMSLVPEEFPVAFTTFMALGAWRMVKFGVLVKRTQVVEALGSASVICTDKTGTITENRMKLQQVYVHALKTTETVTDNLGQDAAYLLTVARWASELKPFDQMEMAIIEAFNGHQKGQTESPYELTKEYPLEGIPPMMTHVIRTKDGKVCIAAKGAPEAFIESTGADKQAITDIVMQLAEQGFRVLGVAEGEAEKDNQKDINFRFLGLLAFYDPPRKGIEKVFQTLKKAGIAIKVVSGDGNGTVLNIAKSVGLADDKSKVITGKEVMDMTDADLKVTAEKQDLFARMFPEAKLKLILALQKSKHVVGMTGDGVNDALALKAADIGIAMGKQGTETAKQAADLVLLKDDFHAIVEAVAMGRRIYVNLKKAFQYIIAIHIPIILTVLLPLVFGWKFSTILLPVHVIFLELIMGPTCSIAFENEPMENDLMTQKPRKVSMALFSLAELGKSLVQGMVISLGVLGLVFYGIVQNLSENDIRGMAFLTLITANIILTFSSRSVDQSIIASFKKPNILVMIIIPITMVLSILLFSIPALRQLFMISLPDLTMGLLSVLVGFLTIIWYEIVKWRNRQA